MQSALDLFYQKGYSKTTFDEIALRIGLTKGAVYWHFKNKPDLVAALINDYVVRKQLYLQKKVPTLNNFKDIEAYFLSSADFILNNPNAFKLAFFLKLQMEWSEAIITKVTEKISQNIQYSFEYIKNGLINMQKNGEINNNINAELLASTIISWWLGCLENYLNKICPIDLKEMLKQSFELLLNGLKRKD